MAYTFAEVHPPSAYHRALLTPSPADEPWLYGTWHSFLHSAAGADSAPTGKHVPPWPEAHVRGLLHARDKAHGSSHVLGRESGVSASENWARESRQRAAAVGGGQKRVLVMMSDSGLERPTKLLKTQRVLYYTRGSDLSTSLVQVGAWPHGLLGHHVAPLLLDETSECLHTISQKGCPLLAIIEDQFDGQIDEIEFLLSPEHILRNTVPPRLVCYLVASASAVDTKLLIGPQSRVVSMTWQHDSGVPSMLHLQDASPAQQRAALFTRLVQLYSLPLQTFEYLVFVEGDLLHHLSQGDIQQFEQSLVDVQPAAVLVFTATCLGTFAHVDTGLVLAGVRWDMWHEIENVVASPPAGAQVASARAAAASEAQAYADAVPNKSILIDVKGMLVDSPRTRRAVSGSHRPMEALRFWIIPGDHAGRDIETEQQKDTGGVDTSCSYSTGLRGLQDSDLERVCRRTQLTQVVQAIALGSQIRMVRASARARDTDARLGVRRAALDEADLKLKTAGQPCQPAGRCAEDGSCDDMSNGRMVFLEERRGVEPSGPDHAPLVHAVLTVHV